MSDTRKRKATDEPEPSNKMPKNKEKIESSDETSKRNEKVQEKLFNDPVHGHIRLHPLCVKIVNTPQFQRLRFIKQLGGAYFVYPGAAHNRFEHSIGVCHLAGTFARELRNQQEADINFLKQKIKSLDEKKQENNAELEEKKQEINDKLVEKEKELITDRDILCVEIAGLCHDLGHGPFSHLFDGIVIPVTRKEKWEHEDGSVSMFDYMLNMEEENGLKAAFKEYGIDSKEELNFIKELIHGKVPDQDFEGRPKEKHFLYQIVSNKESGIDVDKWDYFARDCLMLGMKSNFNHSRAMAFSRVIDVGAKKQICFRDKEAGNLYEMFHIRCMLHRNACHHKTTAVVEIMIADALISAIQSGSEEVKYGRKENGEGYTLAEAVDDMEAFSQITDEVLMKIYHSKDVTLKTAKGIAQRILTRNLYTFVGAKLFEKQPYKKGQDDMTLHDTVRKEIKAKTGELFNQTVEDNIVVHLVRLNYGKNDDDPINFVRFFSKENPNKAFKLPKEKVSHFLPTIFSEQQVLVYCKDKNKDTRAAVERVFKKWSDEKKTNTDKTNPTEHTDQDN